MKLLKKILLFVIVLVMIIFIVQNSSVYPLRLFNWSIELPISLLIFLVYILGMTTGGILFSVIKNLISDENKESATKKNSEQFED